MKTISMRIRGAKTEMEEMGEDTSGMVESTAKLRAEIQALSGVDIMASATEFKSTYQIMDELSQKWKDLSDISQATIIELMAGKHQGNVFASLMENFQTARDALDTSLNSSGSALQEHEKWQKSLEAQILKLQASWQSLSQSFLKSDFLKVALDGVINLVDGITKLIDTFGTLPTLFAMFAGFKGLTSLPKILSTISKSGGFSGIKGLGDVLTALELTFPKTSDGAKKFAGSLKNVVASSGGAKGAIAKLFGVLAGHPYITAAVVAVTALTAAFMYQKKKAEDLAKEVEETTSKYKEQHNELKKLKSSYDTSNESSMISKYEKLSKGVDGLGRNVSLTADEYSEYQNIVNSIAEQIPSLVTGYDAQGNALLSCKGNVEALTEAYEKLIHAQNQEILVNTGDIEKDFSNTLKNAEKSNWLNYIGFGSAGDKVSTSSIELLEKILNGNYSKEEIQSILKKSKTTTVDGIYESLKSAGIGNLGDVYKFEDIANALSEGLEVNPQKIKGIIDDYYTQFADAVGEQKTIAQAKLSEAFDISGVISGLDYDNIGEELQSLAYQTVNSLDYDFFAKLSESGKSVEQWTTEMLDQLNAIGKADNAQIEAGFDLQTKFNGGEISYGEYVKNLNNLESTIDNLNLKSEFKDQLKISLGLDENGIIDQYEAMMNRLTSEEVGLSDKAAKNFLNGLSAEELGVLVDVIPNLDAGATINEIQSLIDEQLAKEFTFDIDAQTAGIEAFNTALSESRSAAGLTSESIGALKSRYEDLEGFNAAALFEKTSNGIHLNTQELSRLEEQYISTNKLDIANNLNKLATKYNDLTEEIKTCTDAQEKESLQLQADKYRDKIDELSTLASQYDGLTSAFAQWQSALEGAEEGDNYDSLYDNLESIKELYKDGLVGTDKFKTAAQLMTSEDLSNASIDEIVSAYQKGYPKMQRYFTEGQKGCKNFLNDVKNLNSEWAHMNEDGSWEINFDTEEIAKGLGVSTDAVLQIAKKLKDYGFEVNFEDSSLDNLKTKIEQTEAKLKELGQSPVDIDVDIDASSANLGKIESEIEKAKSKIKEINSSSVDPKVKTAQLEDAQAKLEALIDKKQEASQPAYMNLNASQVNASLVEALEKVQAYQNAINEVNKLSELKEAGITIDDSQLQSTKEKVDECAKAIQGLDGEVKMAIGLEEDGSIESIKQSFEDGEVKIDADTDPAITKIEQLAENVEKIEDKDVTITVTVDGLDEVKELNTNIDLATNIDGDINNLSEFVEGAKELSNLESNITTYVTANIKGNVIDTAESSIDNLKVFADGVKGLEDVGSFETNVAANLTGNVTSLFEEQIDNLKTFTESAKGIDSIGNVESTVSANIEGNVKDTREYMINNLKEFSDSAKDVHTIGNVESTVSANVKGNVTNLFEEQIDNLVTYSDSAKEVGNIGDVSSTVEANIEGNVKGMLEKSIDNLKVYSDSAKNINSIGNVSSSVDANITGNVTGMLEKSIDNLTSYSESAKDVEGIGNVSSSVAANIEGNVTGMLEKSIDNLKTYSDSAKDIESIGNVESTVNANIEGNVKGMLEKSIDNLKVYSDSAKDIESIGNVESQVVANIKGNVIDTPEQSINNLKTFTDSAKDAKSIGEDIKANVSANVGGNVLDTSESSITKLKTFVDSAQDVKNIGEDTKAKVTANVEGNVLDTLEEKIDNLKTFVDSAKEIDNIGEDVKAKITADIEGNVKDTPEYMINNLSTFVDNAKDIESVGEDVKAKITADVSGNVINTFEGQINNLKTFADSAKNIDNIGEDVKAKVTANVSGNVINTSESSLEKLKLFADNAKLIGKIGEDVKASVTANVSGNVTGVFEEQLDNLGVFADNAVKLKDVGSPQSNVSANVNGNVITDTNAVMDLEHFVSVVNGLSGNQTVSINVTANVDSANINQAITLLTNVANSGVFKNYSATVQVGAAITTIDDTVVQNYKVPEKEGTAKYDVDSSIVDAWTAPPKTGTVTYTPVVTSLTDSQKYKTGTITYNAKVVGFPIVNGTANANGAAFANGTTGKAFKQGDWGVKKTTTALTGELGQELVVYKNRFWTVGDNGAEFTTIPKGAIVFNHRQTEELFANGRVTSDGGRGRILANGTAYVEGTAFNEGVTGSGKFYGNTSSKKNTTTTTTKTTTKTTSKKTAKKDTSKKDTEKEAKKTSDDFEETFDWVEVALSRIQRAIDNIDKKANRTYKSWSSRNKALTSEISKINEEINLQNKAYNRYITEANKVGLGSEWKSKVQNGTLDISTVKNEALAEKIQKYQEYYEKAIACKDAILDLQDAEAELYKQQFDNIAAKYEAKLDRIESQKSITEQNLTQSDYNTKVTKLGDKDYKSLISLERQSISKLKAEKKELEASLNKAVKKGIVTKYSEEWYAMQGTIDEVAASIEESTTNIYEAYENMFDGIAEKYDSVIGRFEGKKSIYETRIEKSQYNTNASKLNDKNYKNIITQEQNIYDQLAKQKQEQQTALDEAVANGLKVGSKKWNDMRTEINNTTLAMEESALNISQIYVDMFEQVGSKYEGVLQGYEHTEAMLDEYISQAEAQGYIVSTKYYDELIKNEKSAIATLKKEQSDLIASRDAAVDNGAIKKGSQAWYDMCAEIDGVTQSIEEGTSALIEYNNAIREIEWSIFDLVQERISDVASESEFLIELMSNDKLYDDKGKLTGQGAATLALRALNHNTAMYRADNYGAEIADIDAKIASKEYDENDQEVINRRRELIELQRESILEAENEKQAIKDLVEEGIDKELDSLNELIDKKKESLEAEKDLYEYNKKVQEQTEEISSLRKQISAYENDNSLEAQAKVQELRVSLQDAETELEETEWDRYIDQQSQLFDTLYTEYETILNTRLDNVDLLLEQVITGVNAAASATSEGNASLLAALSEDNTSLLEALGEDNTSLVSALGSEGDIVKALGAEGVLASALGIEGDIASAIVNAVGENGSIKNILNKEVTAVGTTLSTEMGNIWNTGDGNIKSVLSTYGTNFQNQQTTTNAVLNGIKVSVDKMASASDKEAEKKTTANKTTTSAKKDPTKDNPPKKETPKKETPKKETPKKETPKKETPKKTSGDGKAKVGDKVKFISGEYYYSSDGLRPKGSKYQGKQVYITKINTKSWATHPYHISTGNKLGNGDLGWLKLSQISGYASGKKNFLSDEVAWTQENGQEYIIRPSDGAILTPVAKGDSVLNATASGNIWSMANNPAEFIKDNLKMDASNVPNGANVQNSYVQNFENITFSMPNVHSYDETIRQMQRDPKFEKLILSMTLDQIAGKSPLAKGKSIR